jgi:hypothetical protein
VAISAILTPAGRRWQQGIHVDPLGRNEPCSQCEHKLAT